MKDRTYAKVHLVALLIILALLVGIFWTPPWAPKPALGATRPAFTNGTVHVWYSVDTRLWDVPRAARAAGLGKIRLKRVSDLDVIMCDADHRKSRRCAMVTSLPAETVPCTRPWNRAGSPMQTCLYRRGNPVTSGRVHDSTLDIDDRWGQKLTPAQRHAELVKALKRTVPRTAR